MSECKHERVYSSGLRISWPPLASWICRKCGKEGEHWLWESGAPKGWTDISMEMFKKRAEQDSAEYGELVRKFHPKRRTT